MSHVSARKGWTLEADRVTPAVGGSGVDVGAHHDGFCDLLAKDIARA